MFKNYLKTALRNFRKNTALSLINFGGLSVGIAAVLLIGLYVYGEMGYDDFQQNKAVLYRTGYEFMQNGKVIGEGPEFTALFGPDAQSEFPEVKAFTRLSSERVAYITYNGKTLKVDNIRHADSTFFQLFSYKLQQGNPLTALTNPYTVVLTSQTAEKLFGQQDAVGKTIRLDNQTDYTVTGIVQDAPGNTHLHYNALLSFTTLYKEPGNYMDWNGGEQYSVYLLLKQGANAALLQQKFAAFMWKHINEQYSKSGLKINASLQPVADIHLKYSQNSATLRTNLYVFSAVAFLILVISCVNYVNLSTAQAITRAKEIGVRKVLGAMRGQLIKQFLTETVLLTMAAFITALLLVTLLAPAYKQFTGSSMPALSASVLPALLLLFVVIMATGIVAGSYVAFYLSSFSASRVFKALVPKGGKSVFKKGLIVGQFAVTTGLMACTAVVTMQLQYNKNINLGFDKQNVLVLPLTGNTVQDAYPLLRQQVAQMAAVTQVTGVSEIPYDGITNNGFVPEGSTKAMIIHQLDADDGFTQTFGVSMAQGQFFSKNNAANANGYVINETLAKTLGWQNPLGKTINRNGPHKIIGVVKDFHFASLHDKIEPLIITSAPWQNRYAYIAIKYQPGNVQALINTLKQTWQNTLATAPFDYWFLDDNFNQVYKSEERFQAVFAWFSGLSIILSLAGVFGLVAMAIKQRTKEFGIRKVLGAGTAGIIGLTVQEFAWLVALGAAISTPLAWYYTNKWLQNFAYRIPLNVFVFIACGLVVLLITVATISVQSAKAALANPVKSLRTE